MRHCDWRICFILMAGISSSKQEAQALIKYKDAKRHSSWALEPQIRKYDYVFNGRLRISIRQGMYFRDKDKINVEFRLGEMLIELYEDLKWFILAEKREEAARKQAEAERRKEERRKKNRGDGSIDSAR